jgi:hypothetical protein
LNFLGLSVCRVELSQSTKLGRTMKYLQVLISAELRLQGSGRAKS